MPKQIKIENNEDTINKVTSIDNNSTDDQYPSAKATYSFFKSIEKSIDDIISKDNELIGGVS